MPVMKGLLAPQNTFLDTIATRFDGTRRAAPRDRGGGRAGRGGDPRGDIGAPGAGRFARTPSRLSLSRAQSPPPRAAGRERPVVPFPAVGAPGGPRPCSASAAERRRG